MKEISVLRVELSKKDDLYQLLSREAIEKDAIIQDQKIQIDKHVSFIIKIEQEKHIFVKELNENKTECENLKVIEI